MSNNKTDICIQNLYTLFATKCPQYEIYIGYIVHDTV